MNRRRFVQLFGYVGSAVAGFGAGVAAQRRGLLGKLLRSVAPAAFTPPAILPLEEVERSTLRGRGTVLLVAGQSNAANEGAERSGAVDRSAAFYCGRLYRLRDPLPGASGHGGSIWPLLADLLLKGGHADFVIIASVAQGGTAAAEWAPGGNQWPRLHYAAHDLRSAGFEPTHILWQQGEADSHFGLSAESYQTHLRAISASLRADDFAAPIRVALATYYEGHASETIRRAQSELWQEKGFQRGPDIDSLGADFRDANGVHLSAPGLRRAAELWLATIFTSHTSP